MKTKLIIPTIILVVLCAWTFVNAGTDYSLTTQHYAGLFAAVLCGISFFTFRQYYKYVLGTTLVLGLINILNFTPSKTTTYIKAFGLGVEFQPYILLLIILAAILLMPKRKDVETITTQATTNINERQMQEDVEKFRHLFINKADGDLNEIIDGSKFTAAAKEAARLILDQRGTNKAST